MSAADVSREARRAADVSRAARRAADVSRAARRAADVITPAISKKGGPESRFSGKGASKRGAEVEYSRGRGQGGGGGAFTSSTPPDRQGEPPYTLACSTPQP